MNKQFKTIIAVLIFFSTHAYSQKIIKDTVEISPTTNLHNAAQAITAENWEIEVTITWTSGSTPGYPHSPFRVDIEHYGPDYCFSSYVIVTPSGNSFTFKVASLHAGRYVFEPSSFDGTITQAIIKDTGFPDVVIDNPGYSFDYSTPYSSGKKILYEPRFESHLRKRNVGRTFYAIY